MSNVVSLEAYRRGLKFKAMGVAMRRGKIRLPTDAELRESWLAYRVDRLVDRGLEREGK